MAKNKNYAAIKRLIIILLVVIWLELVMVVKFFTEEYLRYTLEKPATSAMFEVYDADKEENKENKTGYNLIIEKEPENDSQVVEEYVEENLEMQEVVEEKAPEPIKEIPKSVSSRSGTTENVQSAQTVERKEPNSNIIESTYQGYTTVGKIEIPKTGVNMYILSNQTVGGMEIAACQLYSSGELNKSGKTLIVGHNYRNGKLFSNNNKLSSGDIIYITTLDGTKKEYTIYNKILTTPEDVSFLRENSSSPEIILSCCSDDNVSRIVIMAR